MDISCFFSDYFFYKKNKICTISACPSLLRSWKEDRMLAILAAVAGDPSIERNDKKEKGRKAG